MSETPATPPPSSAPSSPTKEDEVKKAVATSNGLNAKKFDGDGQVFKAKLIGMEDLSIDRDEKLCLDSMFKLKAVVRARGEHKQKIQLNLTMSAVKVFDEITKVQIASHEIERISFVVIDPRDTRAFGYIYNTSDDRHQFWAIKTERPAAATVLALKELFELAFEQFTNAEKATEEATKVTTPSSPQSPSLTEATSPVAPVSEPVVSNPTPSLLDDAIWGESPTPVVAKPTEPVNSLWDMDEPVIPVVQPPPKEVNPLEDLFGDLSLTTPTQPPASTVNNNSLLFDAFSNTTPTSAPPAAANPYGNFYGQPAQPSFLNTTPNLLQQQRPSTPTVLPFVQQQRPSTPTTVPFAQQQQQQSPLSAPLISPVAPPSVTSPFAGLDLLGGLSSGAPVKSTKDLFHPTTPAKTMQQLLMEKQT